METKSTIEKLPGTKPGSTINRIYGELLQGKTLTTLEGLLENQTMCLGKYVSLMRIKHKIPIKDKWVEVPSGKHVKEYWIDQFDRQRLRNNN